MANIVENPPMGRLIGTVQRKHQTGSGVGQRPFPTGEQSLGDTITAFIKMFTERGLQLTAEKPIKILIVRVRTISGGE
jgi:hypothetical protein